MNELVIMQGRRAVTTSRNLARDFNKSHKDVLEAIDNVIKGVAENTADLFHETSYVHEQNKQEYREYFMNRDGFTLLAMGFTGQKALQFKLKYINAFNKMEKSLNVLKPLTEKEQLKASMRLSLETSEDVEEVKKEVAEVRNMVEHQITLDHGEQRGLQRAIGRKVFECARSDDHKRLLYPELHREIKDRFGVTSYKDVRRQDLTAAIGYVNAWIPKKAV